MSLYDARAESPAHEYLSGITTARSVVGLIATVVCSVLYGNFGEVVGGLESTFLVTAAVLSGATALVAIGALLTMPVGVSRQLTASSWRPIARILVFWIVFTILYALTVPRRGLPQFTLLEDLFIIVFTAIITIYAIKVAWKVGWRQFSLTEFDPLLGPIAIALAVAVNAIIAFASYSGDVSFWLTAALTLGGLLTTWSLCWWEVRLTLAHDRGPAFSTRPRGPVPLTSLAQDYRTYRRLLATLPPGTQRPAFRDCRLPLAPFSTLKDPHCPNFRLGADVMAALDEVAARHRDSGDDQRCSEACRLAADAVRAQIIVPVRRTVDSWYGYSDHSSQLRRWRPSPELAEACQSAQLSPGWFGEYPTQYVMIGDLASLCRRALELFPDPVIWQHSTVTDNTTNHLITTYLQRDR